MELIVAQPGHPYPDFCFIEKKFSETNSGFITITGEVQGFGWPWSRIRHHALWTQTNGMNVLRFRCIPKGKFSELDGHLTIEAPANTQILHIQP